MKNCPGIPGSSRPRSTRSSVYGPTCSTECTANRLAWARASRLPATDRCQARLSRPGFGAMRCGLLAWRSGSDSARTPAFALAIAWTAAAAPGIVVMHGTRADRAASRMT